jgi:hypothetical protein
MSCHYLPERAVESSEHICLAGRLSAMSNGTTTASGCSLPGSLTDSSPAPRSLVTCVSSHSPVPLLSTEDLRTWLLRGSPVSLSLLPESKGARTTNVTCGQQRPTLFATYSLNPFCLRTRPDLFPADISQPSSVTWPQWGSWAGGELSAHSTPDSIISAAGRGSLPTPSGVNGGKNHTMGRVDEWGGSSNPLRGTVIGSMCLPEFEELVMGWPIGWAALTPYATDKFQEWSQQHGDY